LTLHKPLTNVTFKYKEKIKLFGDFHEKRG